MAHSERTVGAKQRIPIRSEKIQPEGMPQAEIIPKLGRLAQEAVDRRYFSDALTTTQALSLVVGFTGIDTPNVGDTKILVYTDPETGKSNYQSACTPDYGSATPFAYEQHDDPAFGTVIHKPSGLELPVRRHAVYHEASNHYYSRVDPDFNELPTAMISSPYSTCAGGCNGCSRAEIKSFSAPQRDYTKEHVDEIVADYDARGWDPADLISVNLTTGSQPTEEKEVEMMVGIMKEYHRQGFTNARFHIYNYQIRSEEAIRELAENGMVGYIATVEAMNDEVRRKHWGPSKGAITLDQQLKRFEKARNVGVPILEANFVLGQDSYADMMEGISRFDAEGIAVVPNITRNYSARQLGEVHPDVWKMGTDYIYNGFEASLATYGHPTIKAFAGGASVAWLNARGAAYSTFWDLPIRHT